MFPETFKNSKSGRLMRTSIHLASYWAYVPDPLLPALDADWEITLLNSQADRAVSELAGIGRTIPNPAILIGPFMRREAVLSSRIEGTHTGIEELYSYESGHRLPGDVSASRQDAADRQEVLNYVSALNMGTQAVSSRPVDLALICELHRTLMHSVRGDESEPGCVRSIQNFIGVSNDPADAIFIPPPPEELPGLLANFEEYLQLGTVYPPLIQLALLHYQFETIHPFIDGNGRVGRLLLSILPVAWKLLPSPLLYLSAYFESHRSEYYSRLLAVSKENQWRDWLVYFLQGVIEQSTDTVHRAQKLIDLREEWRERLNRAGASANLYTLAESLFESPLISVSDAEKRLGVTNRAARLIIARLEALNILRVTEKKTYGQVYEAAEIFAVLHAA